MLMTKQHFETAFGAVGMTPPAQVRDFTEKLCRIYQIKGIADPAYIANMVGVEFSCGDGSGLFYGAPQIDEGSLRSLAKRLILNYSTRVMTAPLSATEDDVVGVLTRVIAGAENEAEQAAIVAATTPTNLLELLAHPELTECWITDRAAMAAEDGPLLASATVTKGQDVLLRSSLLGDDPESHEGLLRRYAAGERYDPLARIHPDGVDVSSGAKPRGSLNLREAAIVDVVAKPISADAFFDAKCQMPPEDWKGADGTESFKCPEYYSGRVTSIYARIGEQHYTFRDRCELSHSEIISKVQASLDSVVAPLSRTASDPGVSVLVSNDIVADLYSQDERPIAVVLWRNAEPRPYAAYRLMDGGGLHPFALVANDDLPESARRSTAAGLTAELRSIAGEPVALKLTHPDKRGAGAFLDVGIANPPQAARGPLDEGATPSL